MLITFTVLESPTLKEHFQTFSFVPIGSKPITIGRAADSHVRLTGGGYISRNQLSVEYINDQYVIRDVGSRNKTFIRRTGTINSTANWQLIADDYPPPSSILELRRMSCAICLIGFLGVSGNSVS